MLKFKIILVLAVVFLMIDQPVALTLGDINVVNSNSQATVTLGFYQQPVYTFFLLHNPERMVVDIHKSGPVRGLPLKFSSSDVIKCIRTSTPLDKQSLRLVFELTCKSSAQVTTYQVGGRYNILLIITTNQKPVATPSILRRHIAEQIVVAIDAGHGGQDPGAIGVNGLHEKNVTIAIARKLKMLLDADSMFKSVLTRDGDYFVSVMGRSDVARRKGASVLVSIHADAAPNRRAIGASVWVLSNRRANSEMANWLEQYEKQSELLGGAGDLLANSQADPYFSQVVLDLQFGHSQRVGYDIAMKVLGQLERVGALHKRQPEHASLGVLRSPDIPSLLVETGFISNIREERLLGSSVYQAKIANALYLGLRTYFLAHPLQIDPKLKNQQQNVSLVAADSRHIVSRGETLYSIARQHLVSIASIRMLNGLKKDSIWVGQCLLIPINESVQTKLLSVALPTVPVELRHHRVMRGDTLTAIAAHYGVSAGAIKRANNMSSNNIRLEQMLTIPSV